MSAETVTYRWTREQYERAVESGVFGDDRVELLDGEIVPMAPPSSWHAATTRWLRNTFVRGLDPIRWLVGGRDPIALDDWSEPEPDIWVARADRVLGRTHPPASAMALVVEVSWTSACHDRVRKLPLHGAAGVPEYWIVDLQRGVVHVHRQPVADGYRDVSTAARGDGLTVPGTDLTVDVTELLGPEGS
jgi:Uma2 family endonuclease